MASHGRAPIQELAPHFPPAGDLAHNKETTKRSGCKEMLPAQGGWALGEETGSWVCSCFVNPLKGILHLQGRMLLI